MLEPIFGEGGILKCSPEFFRECRALADQHQAALIFDEIQCGLGRTGTIFAFQTFGVVPDIVTIAKPIAAGLPLGAFISKEQFASAISPGQHGTTFGGGPLACRVALEYLAIVEQENLLENVVEVGGYLHQQLQGWLANMPLRGRPAAAASFRGSFSIFRRVLWWSRDWLRACFSMSRKTPYCASCRRSYSKKSTWTREFEC